MLANMISGKTSILRKYKIGGILVMIFGIKGLLLEPKGTMAKSMYPVLKEMLVKRLLQDAR